MIQLLMKRLPAGILEDLLQDLELRDSQGGGYRTGSPAFRRTLRTPHQDFNIPSAEGAEGDKRSRFTLKGKQPVAHLLPPRSNVGSRVLHLGGGRRAVEPLSERSALLTYYQQFHEGWRLKICPFLSPAAPLRATQTQISSLASSYNRFR